MEVKKIVEGMTAQQVAQVIDDNFKAQNAILEEDIATQNSVIGVSEYKDFSEAEAVNVGDVRKYNGFLYECVEATTGAFDASKWKKSNFKNETEKKLSELGSEVWKLSLGEIPSSKNYQVGYSIDNTGSVVASPANSVSEFIDLKGNTNIGVFVTPDSNGKIVLYDGDKNYVDYYTNSSYRSFDLSTITTPVKYIRVVSSNEPIGNTKVILGSETEILWEAKKTDDVNIHEKFNNLESNINSIEKNVVNINNEQSRTDDRLNVLESGDYTYPPNYQVGYSIDDTGSVVASPANSVSEFIDLKGNTNIGVFVTPDSNGKIVLYDGDKNYVDYYSNASYRRLELNTITPQIKFVRIVSGSNPIGNTSVLDADDGVIWNAVGSKQVNVFDESSKNKTTRDIMGFPSVINKDITWSDGYRNPNGDIATSTLWKISNPIPMSGGESFSLSIKTIAESVYSCCLVDKDNNYIKVISFNENDIYFLADSDCYIGLSVFASDKIATSFVSSGFSKGISKELRKIDTSSENVIIQSAQLGRLALSNLNWLDRRGFNTDNIVRVETAILSTDYIPINNWNFIRFENKGSGTYLVVVNFYDKDFKFIQRVGWKNDNELIDCNGLASFIRISLQYNNGNQLTGYSDDFELGKLSLVPILDDVEYEYEGKPIVIKPKLKWKTIANAPYSGSVQGADEYNDILFQFYGREFEQYPLRGCVVIDLAAKKILQEIELGYDATDHCNSATFGIEKYDDSDVFPLIYTSTLNNTMVRVYRVTLINGVYGLQLVQTINYDSSYSTATWFVDSRGFLYAERLIRENPSVGAIDKYKLPSIKEGEIVTLNKGEVLDSFEFSLENPYGVPAYSPEQDGIINNGILYQANGFGEKRNWINVIDLDNKKILSTISLSSIGLDYEPEGVFIHKGNLGVSFNENGKIVELAF